jgi:hypothetical protein
VSDYQQYRTAFLIVQHQDGKWEALTDTDADFDAEHTASLAEMRGGAEHVAFEIGANITASLTVQHQLQMAQGMQRAAADEQLKRKLLVP